MKPKLIILVIIVIAGALGWFFFGRKEAPQEISLAPQTNTEGSVEVKVTPVDVTESHYTWRFDIVLNTHSVELDQDMSKAVFLKDERGNIYPSWEGTPPGGHHRQGTLIFPAIRPKPKTITLVLKDIGGISERKFSW